MTDDGKDLLLEPCIKTHTWSSEAPSDVVLAMREALRELRRFDPIVCIYVESFEIWKSKVKVFEDSKEWAQALMFFDVKEHKLVPKEEAWVEYKSGVIQKFSLKEEF